MKGSYSKVNYMINYFKGNYLNYLRMIYFIMKDHLLEGKLLNDYLNYLRIIYFIMKDHLLEGKLLTNY